MADPEAPSPSETPQPPVAERRPVESTHHDDVRVDDYGWLAEPDDPAVLEHLKAENTYSEALTGHLEQLRTQIFDEIVARTRTEDVSVPTRRGPWWYFSRSVDGAQYPVFVRVPAAETAVEAPDAWTPPPVVPGESLPGEEVLLDANLEAGDAAFFSLGAFSAGPDHRLLAYSVDEAGDERFSVRVIDLATRELVDDAVTGIGYGLVWNGDGTGFYYTEVDQAWRPYQVRLHLLGTPAADDRVIYTDPDERFWVGIGLSTSRRFIFVGSGSRTTSEYHLIDLARPEELRLIAARSDGIEYDVDHAVIEGTDQLVIVHNGLDDAGGKADDFMVSLAPVDTPGQGTGHSAGDGHPAGQGQWRTLIPHTPGVRITGASCLNRAIAVSLRRDGLARVELMPLGGGDTPEDAGPVPGVGPLRPIEVDSELFTMHGGAVADPAAPYVRLSVTSFATPTTIYDCDLGTRELVFRKQVEVQGVDLSRYTERREWAVAADGTRVPISLVHRVDLAPDGRNPVLLYGYGSYESPIDPGFGVPRLSLLDRGVVFAVAHVRGGGELGRAWYEGGRLDRKKNTFTDFVACAEALVETGWADPSRVVAMGGSAGGLLMGAVANLAPERFAGVVASVPFVDVLTTMLDPSLPLTVIEREEWGDPLGDPAAYEYIKSYAPYEQVDDLAYPPILAITSLNDTRVRYVEPAKWIARLRAVAPGAGPYLLKIDLEAGHGGGSGRYTAWKERAYEYAWVLDRLGCA